VQVKYIEIDQYIANPSTENRDKLVEILGEERFKISDLGVTSRVFSNWKLNNVIPKDDGRQWVRLNFFEFFWIQIIKDLRDLGIPLDRIATVKDQLFQQVHLRDIYYDEHGDVSDETLSNLNRFLSEEEIIQFKDFLVTGKDNEQLAPFLDVSISYFFGLVVNVLINQSDDKITIDKDGNVDYIRADIQSDSYSLNPIYSGPVVIISLKRYLYMLMTEPQHIPRAHQLGLLNSVESEVIQSMRVNNLRELTISFDPSEAYQDITYTWSKNIKQEDMEHVMNQFLGKKHVALTMKSNDGKTVQYEYQNRKRIYNK
jgi:hypothetical protein